MKGQHEGEIKMITVDVVVVVVEGSWTRTARIIIIIIHTYEQCADVAKSVVVVVARANEKRGRRIKAELTNIHERAA